MKSYVGQFDTDETLVDPYPVRDWTGLGKALIEYDIGRAGSWPPVAAFEACMVETFGEFPTPYWKTLTRRRS